MFDNICCRTRLLCRNSSILLTPHQKPFGPLYEDCNPQLKRFMKVNRRFLVIICLVFLGHFISSGQSHHWIRSNPGGGGAYSTVGASASGIIVAGSDLSGAYVSSNGGNTWEVIGANRGMDETHVSGVGFHRTNGNVLYIGTENGLFRSDNGGNSVSKVLSDGYITDIEFGTNQLSIGYASHHPAYNSAEGEIFKSIDNGLTWSQVSTNLPTDLRILKLLVDPSDVNRVYLLSGNGRFACSPADVYRSENGGVTWTNLTTGLSAVLDVALDPTNAQNVYLTTMNADCAAQFYWTDLLGSIYKSTDRGDSWGSALSDYTGVIWPDASNASIIRLIDPRQPWPWISRSGTFTSTDGGATFSKTGDVEDWDVFFNGDLFYSYSSSYNGICKTLGEDLSNPSNYYWVNYQWVFKTDDHGTTFNNVFTNEISPGSWRSRGFDNVNMMEISISESNPAVIFLAYFDIGIWRSLDQGESWQSCNPKNYSGGWNGHGGNCATILSDPVRSHVVWASMSGNQNGQSPTYLLRNTNSGDTADWVMATGLPDTEIMGLSMDRTSAQNNRVLYVTAAGDVFKSTNDGVSWANIFDCNGCRFTAVDQLDGNVVYTGGEVGLWRSTNGGTSWDDVSDPQMNASAGKVFWDDDYDGVFDVETDPNHAQWVYVTALGNNKGLFKSINMGTTWSKILTDDFMRKVAIAPSDSEVLYATSSSAFERGGYDVDSRGVLFSDDGGDTWIEQNQGMAYPFAMAVGVDRAANPTVYVGSPGTGFQKSFVPGLSTAHIVTKHNAIEIFPNPFTDKVIIDGIFTDYSLGVYNEIGQLIQDYTGSSNPLTIDLGSLTGGIYFISIQSDVHSNLGVYKIIKE